MAQFTIRNLEEDVKLRLKRRANRNGTSLEEEVRRILRNTVRNEGLRPRKLGSRIAARFATVGLDEPLPELHGEAAQQADFLP